MRNRLHSLCPYFAMFPESFVENHVAAHTVPNDLVLDPFSGRGTTVFQSLLMDRKAIAMDTNPVAFCVSSAKANVPHTSLVMLRIDELEAQYNVSNIESIVAIRKQMPTFFKHAFYYSTLHQLLFMRQNLHWQYDSLDRFIAAMMLGCLHGERDRSSFYFSNQMPRTISTKPQYSINYWKNHNLRPHKRQVFDILRSRCRFRMVSPRPARNGEVVLADSRRVGTIFQGMKRKVKAVITSPPYLNVTSYEEDQWLRLWMLGGDPFPTYNKVSPDDRHVRPDAYWRFLADVWCSVSSLLAKDAVVVVRLGAKGLSADNITRGLIASMVGIRPNLRLVGAPQISNLQKRQTDSFRPGSKGCAFEVDYVFSTSNR